MPSTLSIVTNAFTADRRANAVGTWAGVAGGGAVIGLLLSGVLLEIADWRWVFATNAISGRRGNRPRRDLGARVERPGARCERPGGCRAVGGRLSAVVFATIEGPQRGWTDVLVTVGYAVGALALGGFLFWESRRANPLLDPRLFRGVGFADGSLSISLQFLAFFGFVFIGLQYLQLVHDYSPLQATVALVPMAVALGALTPGRAATDAPFRHVIREQLRPCGRGGWLRSDRFARRDEQLLVRTRGARRARRRNGTGDDARDDCHRRARSLPRSRESRRRSTTSPGKSVERSESRSWAVCSPPAISTESIHTLRECHVPLAIMHMTRWRSSFRLPIGSARKATNCCTSPAIRSSTACTLRCWSPLSSWLSAPPSSSYGDAKPSTRSHVASHLRATSDCHMRSQPRPARPDPALRSHHQPRTCCHNCRSHGVLWPYPYREGATMMRNSHVIMIGGVYTGVTSATQLRWRS